MPGPRLLTPSTTGRGLVNLVAELETRLTGAGRAPLLDADLAERIPPGDSAVMVLFDGLGAAQIEGLDGFGDRAGRLHAPFPTTTTVSLATVATGRVPAGHGVIGHLMWLPRVEAVVNMLKFVTPAGGRVDFDHSALLPGTTLWERLRDGGVEPVTVQPGSFADTPLSRALYRGCRFEPVWSAAEWIDAVTQLSASLGRFVFAYWPEVDVAAHVGGQSSDLYRRAVAGAERMWRRLSDRVTVPLVGTADHGHLDYREADKTLLRGADVGRVTWFGDPRALMVRGDVEAARRALTGTGATLLGPDRFVSLFGDDPEPHPELSARLPHLVALAGDGSLLLPPGFDRRLVGYHGGLRPEEVEIPLLVGPT